MPYRYEHAENVKTGDKFQLAGQMMVVVNNVEDIYENRHILAQRVNDDPTLVTAIIIEPNQQFTIHDFPEE